MPSRLDNIDEFVVRTVFEDNGAVKGFEILDKKQNAVIENNKKVVKTQNEVAKSGFALGKAFRVLGAYIGIKEIVKYADEWSNIRTTLGLITESEKERARVQSGLLGIANGTRQSMSATVDLYSKLTNNAQKLGLSEQKRLKLTDLINKSLAIGGGTPESNKSVLLQFGQALGIGKFAGQDLKSIMQNNQGFAKIIAKGLGVDVGDLTEMGASGELTADKVVNAILKMNKEINDSFQKVNPTIGGSFVVLTNNIGNFIDRLNQATGASKIIARTIMLVANNLDKLTVVLAVAFIPKLIRAIPLLDLFFLNLASGSGILAALKGAFLASLPAMRAWTAQAWAMAAPFIKIYAVIELVLQAIKMLKGEWNWYAEFIDSIERGTQKGLNWLGRKTGLWQERTQFNGTFSQGALYPNAQAGVTNKNVNQTNNYYINSMNPQSTASAIDMKTRNNLKGASVTL